MSRIRIVADSTCDLTKDLLERYDITTIPLCIVMDEKSYYDGEEVTPDDIYKWADENNTTPKTAAITFEKAEEVLKPFMEAGDDIIFFGIASGMSTTCNVIRLIGEQEEYERIFIVDSQNLSTGIGHLVVKAAELVKEGKTAEEIVEIVNAARSRVRASFVVDTLTYLARGGRCSAASAMLGTMLKLHPMIVVKDGAMGASKKYRGSIDSALQKYVKDLREDLLAAESDRVFITHSGCKEETIDAVYQFVKELGYFKEIHITRAGGVISSHCGPGTLGVLYCEKE